MTSSKTYKLLSPNGEIFESAVPGELGGNKMAKIYGRFDCFTANRAIKSGYAQHRVFFKDEEDAIAAGYRPCGNCMTVKYRAWRNGVISGKNNYPWLIKPD